MIKIFITIALIALSTKVICGPNLLDNGSFDSGDGGLSGKQPGIGRRWEGICGGPHPEIYALDDKVKHSGKCSQRMTCTGFNERWTEEGVYCFNLDKDGKEVVHPAPTQLGFQAIAQTTKPGAITPGKTYRLSAWVKIDGLTGKWEWFRLDIFWLDKDGKFISENRESENDKGNTGSHDWKYLTAEGVAPANAAYAKAYLHHHFATGAVWYDDVWLGEVRNAECGMGSNHRFHRFAQRQG